MANLVDAISQCDRNIQERMVWHRFMIEDELGHRASEGVGISLDEVRDLPPLATQTLTDEEQQRLTNLGNNAPRDVSGLTMTHCVPNERDERFCSGFADRDTEAVMRLFAPHPGVAVVTSEESLLRGPVELRRFLDRYVDGLTTYSWEWDRHDVSTWS